MPGSRILRLWLIGLAFLAGAAAAETAAGPVLRVETGMHAAMINRIAEAEDGTLVTASDDKTIRLWSPDGTPQGVLRGPIGPGDDGALYALAIGGRFIAGGGRTAAGEATAVRIFDRADGRLLGSVDVPGRYGVLTALAFSPAGGLLAAGFERGGIRVFDLDGQQLALVDEDYAGAVAWLDFGPGGSLAVTAEDGVRVYGTDLTQRRHAELSDGAEPWSVSFSPDGRHLAVGSFSDATVRIIAVDTLAESLRLQGGPDRIGNLAAATWSADGRTIVAGGTYRDSAERRYLRVWPVDREGDGRDLDIAGDDTVTDVTGLANGGIAYATATPSWGLLDPQFRPTIFRGRSQADFRDGHDGGFAVSDDGMRVRFGYLQGGERPVEFDLAKRTLRASPSPSKGLEPPVTASNGIAVENWRNSTSPQADGVPILLEPNEISRSAAMAADGNAFVLGTSFYLRHIRRGFETWRQTLPAPAWTVALSGDGRFALAALGDGTIRWYRRSDGREVLALFAHADGRRWIAWTPDGFFDHSPADAGGAGGETLIGYHINRGPREAAEFVAVDQMYDRFYRPDLLLRRIAGRQDADEATVGGTGGAAGVETVLGRGLPPKIDIIGLCPAGQAEQGCDGIDGTRGPVVVGTPEIVLRVRAEDRGGGIGPVVLRRNGAALDGSVGHAVDADGGATQELRVRLAPGENRITVSAFSAAGDIEAKEADRASATVRYDPPAAAPDSGASEAEDTILYVIAVGVSDYAVDAFDLQGAANDALAVARTMKASEGRIYRRAELLTLLDGDATAGRIAEAFRAVGAEARPQDMVMVFLAGHGIALDGRYHFAPHDLGVGDPALLASAAGVETEDEGARILDELFRKGGLSQDHLVDLLRGIAAERVVVVLDTCYAGTLATLDATSRAAQNQTFTATLGRSAGRIVLAGANGEALDTVDPDLPPDQRHGLFTQVLLDGLEGGADIRGRGVIRITDLADYVREGVVQLAASLRDVQEPAYYFAGNTFFDLRAIPHADPK